MTLKVETNLSLSLPGSFLTSGLAENHLKLTESTIPALILRAGEDNRIHPQEVQALYDALPEDTPKRMLEVEGAYHGIGFEGSIPAQGLGAYEDILMSFLEELAPDCLSD